MDEIVSCQIKTMAYASQPVLRDIDLRVAKGQLMVLTGLSGCGKTSLLRLINGLVPDLYEASLDGQVRVLGKDLTEYQPGELAKHVGNVFQNPNDQFFSTRVEDEIALVGENLGMEPGLLEDRVHGAMERLGITDLADRSVHDLSGGQKQKVALASCLVYDTDLIIMDEPSSSLDYESIQDLRRIIIQLRDLGKTLIIADHRLYYLTDIMDELIVMEKGTIKASYQPQDLSESVRQAHGLRVFKEEDLEAERVIQPLERTIRVEGLRIENKGFSQAQKISFDLGPGEIMGLVGPNGVGKSTLAKQLVGLLPIKEGQISYGASKRERLKATAISLQQSSNMFFKESVERELISRDQMKDEPYLARVKKALVDIDLWEERTFRPQELSGGQKQRLVVIIAALKEAQLMILDEPTSGLDYKRMGLVADYIIERSKDLPIMLITHDLEVLFKSCNTVLLLSEDSYEKIPVQGNEKRILAFVQARV